MNWSRVLEAMRGGCADPFFAAKYFKKNSEAPDYTPMANASAEAAQIGADLSREQMAVAKDQYEREMKIVQPVVDAQLDLMKQQKQQGDDMYDYMVSNQRPVEEALNDEAMTGQPSDATKVKMEEAAGKAAADARQGTTQQQNQLIRQGLRYGFAPAKMAQTNGAVAAQAGLGIASAMNQARDKEQTMSWAKKMDVAGLYRGLAGASQGAYSLATNSGNSAVGNSMQPGNQIIGATNAAAGTTMQGQGLRVQGLGTIIGSQTAIANSNAAGNGQLFGSLLGAGGTLGGAFL